jgi:thymidylate synthase (FAD)
VVHGDVTQLAECQPSKLNVAGSIPVIPSNLKNNDEGQEVIVTPVAQTTIMNIPESLAETALANREDTDTDIDLLGEYAGRGCYKSWHLPNEKTASNQQYIENIQNQKHFSVLEHGSVTFYVEDVSRALLLELERHRHISFSVESQRYVNTQKFHPDAVSPPAFEDDEQLYDMLQKHYKMSLDKYDFSYNRLRDKGYTIKKAREASRAFLLESTPVDFFVTGNMRAWRDVLAKRHSEHADAEIQEFAGLVLEHLRGIAPNSFQDISEAPSDE